MPSIVENSTRDESAAVKYNKAPRSTPDGYCYEECVLALVFLRCLKQGLIFQLSANNADAGKFEDLALVWRREGDPKARMLLVQMKHTTSIIDKGALLGKARKSDFVLDVYCTSYQEISKKQKNQEIVTCVLLTNGRLEESAHDMFVSPDVGNDPGLGLLQAGGVLCKINPTNRDVPEAVHENTHFLQNFFLLYDQGDCKEIVRDICAELKELQRAGELSGPFSDKLCEDLCKDLCDSLREWMDTWGECATSGWTYWHALVVKYSTEEVATGLQYCSVANIQGYLESHNPAWVRPPKRGTEALSATKIKQALGDEKHIMVAVGQLSQLRRRILHCWGAFCQWLVIVDDDKESSSDVLDELVKKAHTERRLVIVSSREGNCFEDTCQSSEVSDDSWEEFLDVRVTLNGERYECRLRDLVAGVDDRKKLKSLKSLLDGQPALLLVLAQLAPPLMMGGELETLPHYYVHRKLLCGQRERNEFSSSLCGFPEYEGGEEKELLEVLDAASNIVIVEGRPGVGKSKLLSDMAKKLKDRDPACWLLRVNLCDFYTVLDNSDSDSGVSAVEGILNATLANKGELGRLEYALYRHSLLESRKVVCLVDGFDEVYPDYVGVCLKVLPLLVPRKGKLVVTTRPGQVKLLENRLGVRAHSVEPFSYEEQEEFFNYHTAGERKVDISYVNSSLGQLLRIPLFAEMYASLVQEATQTYNIVSLYEAFIRKAFIRLYKEQWGDNLSAPGKKKEVEEAQKRYEEQLMDLAEATLVSSVDLPSMPTFSMDNFKKPGIAYEHPDRTPAFLHRSFAEYFLAKRLVLGKREQSYVVKVYREAYRGQTLVLFLTFFTRLAARGRPLVEAVVDSDVLKVRALLAEGADPRQTDACGRNALHLSCSGMGIPVPALWENYCDDALEDMVSAEDGLLGWTPLRYAAEGGDWISVYWLLMRAGCELSLLGDFAARLHDPAQQLQSLFQQQGYRALRQHVIRVNDSSSNRAFSSAEIQIAVSLMSADMPEDSVELIAEKAQEEGDYLVCRLLLWIYCGKPIADVRPYLIRERYYSFVRKLTEYGWRGWEEPAMLEMLDGTFRLEDVLGESGLKIGIESLFEPENPEKLRDWIRLHLSSRALQRSQQLGGISADEKLEELLHSVEKVPAATVPLSMRGFEMELPVEMDVEKKRFRRSPVEPCVL